MLRSVSSRVWSGDLHVYQETVAGIIGSDVVDDLNGDWARLCWAVGE
jgi:hypothetical protein